MRDSSKVSINDSTSPLPAQRAASRAAPSTRRAGPWPGPRAATGGACSRPRTDARLQPETRPLDPAHDLVRTALDPASQRRARRRPPAEQGPRPPLVVPEDNVEDDPRVGGIALVAVPLKIAAAHVQLDVPLQQASRRGDQRITEVASWPAAEPPPVDNAQLLSL